MNRSHCAYALVLLAAATPAQAGASVLPDRFGAWQAAGPAVAVKTGDLGPKWDRWMEGEQILAESGIVKIEDRAYKNGADQLCLRIYQFKYRSSAYEFYTFAVLPGMMPLGVGQHSAIL